jgi:hypothetical protein
MGSIGTIVDRPSSPSLRNSIDGSYPFSYSVVQR